jgi:uncharacterized membrane protein
MDKSRLEAFSDGVFAVAITLLALDLVVRPPGSGHSVAWQLGHQWPQFVAYVVSFFTIGIIWVNHHALFKTITGVDRTVLFLNLSLLAVVVLFPFATSMVADYLTADNWDASVAAAFYSSLGVAMSVCFTLIFRWSVAGNHQIVPIPPDKVRGASWRFSIGLVFYVVAVGAAFISAPLALAINGAIAAYYVFEHTPAGHLHDGERSGQPAEPTE